MSDISRARSEADSTSDIHASGAASHFDRLVNANGGYAAARENVSDPRPSRRLAVVTCMDARIDVFAVLGLHLGEAHIIRNAGGRVTEDVVRSLALSSHVLGVNAVVLMQHTKCGLSGVTDDELRRITGSDIGFLPIGDHVAALSADLGVIVGRSYLAPIKDVAAFVYDVESGEITEIARRSLNR